MPRSYLTRKHCRCLTWEKQHRRQPSPPLAVKQNFLNTPPNRDEETKSLTSSTAQVVEIKLLRAKPHMKIQNTRDQVGEKSITSVKGKSLTSLISKELKMENILLTKTQKIGKTTSKQFLIAALEAHDSIHKFNGDNSASLRRRGSSWNHYHDPRGTQPPRLQAFLLYPFFWGQNTWENTLSTHFEVHRRCYCLEAPRWTAGLWNFSIPRDGGVGCLAKFQILHLKTSVHSLSSRGLQGTWTLRWSQIALQAPITPVMWSLPSLSHLSCHTARSSATVRLWSRMVLFSC